MKYLAHKALPPGRGNLRIAKKTEHVVICLFPYRPDSNRIHLPGIRGDIPSVTSASLQFVNFLI
jgi:hypothetical protein